VVFPLRGRARSGPVPVSFRSDGHVTPRFNASGGALLFHLLSKLYERTSMVITTNPRLSKWAAVFGDARMTTTLLDRLTHRCHILETGIDRFRFMASSAAASTAKKTKETTYILPPA
jgi:hypothetical protein